MYFTSENILLIGSVLVFVAILISRAGYRFGVPTLLLFLLVGMIFGRDGLGINFDNYRQAQFVGIVALNVILFAGGMETKFDVIKPVLGPGIILSTIGVLLTTAFTGGFIFLMSKAISLPFEVNLVMCFLLAAVMSSTDSATVFNILRNSRSRLKENLRPLLELESGSNDPMAYVTTIVLIGVAQGLGSETVAAGDGNIVMDAVRTLILQIGMGAFIGTGIGYGTTYIMKRVRLDQTALYSIMIICVSFFTYSITGVFGGNGFLAVYIAGLIIGNTPMEYKYRRDISTFLDGMTWLMQIGMFLTLGLLVSPREMLAVAPIAILIGIFLMFVGRPLAVYLCLLGYRKIPFKAKAFASWVGLKGAAPIIFATYPVVQKIPGSEQIFNIVFFITLLSLVIQGMSINKVAQWLGLALPQEKETETFGIDIPDEAGKLIDCTLSEDDLKDGNTLKEVSLPDGARVVMIQRGSRLIVPDGSVELNSGDKLLMILGERRQSLMPEDDED